MRILGVGVDLVDVSRIERILERFPRFASKHFSPHEIAYCDAQGRRAECYAARWAAREAFAKAVGGVPGGRFRDAHVVRDDDGSVRLSVEGPAKERMDAIGASDVLLSLTHERRMAAAFCVAVAP